MRWGGRAWTGTDASPARIIACPAGACSAGRGLSELRCRHGGLAALSSSLRSVSLPTALRVEVSTRLLARCACQLARLPPLDYETTRNHAPMTAGR